MVMDIHALLTITHQKDLLPPGSRLCAFYLPNKQLRIAILMDIEYIIWREVDNRIDKE